MKANPELFFFKLSTNDDNGTSNRHSIFYN